LAAGRPADPDVLLSLLFAAQSREKVLRFLTIAPPKAVSPGLLEALAADPDAQLALVRIARSRQGVGLIDDSGIWLMTARPALQQLQIVLALLVDPENRRAVLALEGIPRLFAALVIVRETARRFWK
jgi:hypothetical protein